MNELDQHLLLSLRELVIRAFDLPPDLDAEELSTNSLFAGLHKARAEGFDVAVAARSYAEAQEREATRLAKATHHAHIEAEGVWRAVNLSERAVTCSPLDGVTCSLLPGVSYLPAAFAGEFVDQDTNLRTLTGQLRLIPPGVEVPDRSVELTPTSYWARFDALYKLAEAGTPVDDALFAEIIPHLDTTIRIAGEMPPRVRAEALLRERAGRLKRAADTVETAGKRVFTARLLRRAQ